mgnify:CR=1 FL=1
MVGARKGTSLAELVVVVVILAAMAMVAVPRFSHALVRMKRAEAAAAKLVTDLRLTRSMAIRDAATNRGGYKLEMTGTAPYSGYRIEAVDTHQVAATHTFEPGVTVLCAGASRFVYLPLGNLKADESGTQITVAAEGMTLTLTLDAVSATGSVQCTKE